MVRQYRKIVQTEEFYGHFKFFMKDGKREKEYINISDQINTFLSENNIKEDDLIDIKITNLTIKGGEGEPYALVIYNKIVEFEQKRI